MIIFESLIMPLCKLLDYCPENFPAFSYSSSPHFITSSFIYQVFKVTESNFTSQKRVEKWKYILWNKFSKTKQQTPTRWVSFAGYFQRLVIDEFSSHG